jgi:hypothetical protein
MLAMVLGIVVAQAAVAPVPVQVGNCLFTGPRCNTDSRVTFVRMCGGHRNTEDRYYQPYPNGPSGRRIWHWRSFTVWHIEASRMAKSASGRTARQGPGSNPNNRIRMKRAH